jgi:hypothetical protein
MKKLPFSNGIKWQLSFFLLLLIHVSFFKVSAQSITLSPQNIDDPGFEHVKVIGQDDEGFYLLQSNLSLNSQRDRIGFRNRKYKLRYFDFNLNARWDMRLEDEKDNFNIDLVAMFNGHPVILRSQWLKNENTLSYSLSILDNKGKVTYQQKPVNIVYNKDSDLEKARLIVSKDNSLACIVVEELRNTDQVLHIIAIDTALNTIYKYDPVINYTYKQLEVDDVAVADEGQVAVLTRLELRMQEENKKKQVSYKLFVLQNGSTSFSEHAISSASKQLTEASLSIDNVNHKTVVTGFFSDNESYTGTGIIFASKSLTTNDDVEIKAVNIDDNARIKLVGERNSGANTGLYSYPIRKLILRSDGGAVVVAEAAYYSEYSYYDYFTQSFTRRIEYHFDNVVIMSIHSNGTIDWSTVLRKSQETLDDGGVFSSFATVLQSDRIDLIYNKDMSRSNQVASFSVDNKGVNTLKNVTRPENNFIIVPQSAKQVDENVLVVAVIQKKKLYLLKITL